MNILFKYDWIVSNFSFIFKNYYYKMLEILSSFTLIMVMIYFFKQMNDKIVKIQKYLKDGFYRSQLKNA